MNEDFFDWLDKCPTNWILQEEDEDNRVYSFCDNDEDIEELNCGLNNKK